MNRQTFEILEFKLEMFVIDPAIVMIAKRGSGKSFICRDIIYHYRKIPGGVVISPTDKMSAFYSWFFPELYIHYEITEELLKNILRRQVLMRQKHDVKKKLGRKVDPSSILIMDDCLSKKKTWARLQSITEILMNGRHYKLTYLLTMQSPMGLEPDLRLNFDYVFLLKDDSFTNKKKLYENYASIFPNIHIFTKAFESCTSDYRAMVVDNRKPADKISDKIYWFKAQDRTFTFGSKRFKEIHQKYFDPDFLNKLNQEIFNIEDFAGKKPGPGAAMKIKLRSADK